MSAPRITRREASTVIASAFGSGLLSTNLFAEQTDPLDLWVVGRSVSAFQPLDSLKLAQTKEAGFRCLELSVTGPNTDNWDAQKQLDWYHEFKDQAESLNLTVRSVHIPFRHRDISGLDDEIRKKVVQGCAAFFDLKNIFGAKIYVLHPSSEPIKPEDRPKRIENCIESLKILAPIAKEKGVCIALENIPRTCLANTSKETIEIVDAVGNTESLRVCFDSNHTLQEDADAFVAAVGNRIVTVHMSDRDAVNEKHWLPYEGVVNWKAVMTELVKTGYPGPFVFETNRFKDRDASPQETFATWLRIKEEFLK